MLSTLVSIWLLHLAVLLSPGVNFMLLSQLAAAERTKSALFAVWGIVTGTAVWAICAVLGVHALFLAFPSLRLLLQVAGGVYLLYISSRLWRSYSAPKPQITPESAPQITSANEQTKAVSPLAAFRLGFLTNITNPKPALFFGSVFVASFPTHPTLLLQISAVCMVVLNSLAWHLLLTYVFSRPSVRNAYTRTRNAVNRVASAIVGALGVSLLVSTVREARS